MAPLTLDDALAKEAEAYAQELPNGIDLSMPATDNGHGENLYWYSASTNTPMSDASKSWYDLTANAVAQLQRNGALHPNGLASDHRRWHRRGRVKPGRDLRRRALQSRLGIGNGEYPNPKTLIQRFPFFFTLNPGAPPEPDVFHGS